MASCYRVQLDGKMTNDEVSDSCLDLGTSGDRRADFRTKDPETNLIRGALDFHFDRTNGDKHFLWANPTAQVGKLQHYMSYVNGKPMTYLDKHPPNPKVAPAFPCFGLHYTTLKNGELFKHYDSKTYSRNMVCESKFTY